jgi:hypothetical protein
MGIISEIKKDATGNKTKIQSSDASKLEKIFNNMFFLEKNIEEETKFVKQVMTRGADTQERIGLHASALISGEKDFCLRQQVLSLMYHQLQGEQISVGLKRVFEEGNAIHEKWQRMFIRAGYSKAEDLDMTQFNKQWRVSFTPDVICYIPEFYDGKMIGELKSVNTFQFQHMTKHPSAWKQCQWYMCLNIAREKKAGTWNGKDYLKGFVLSEDKNTQDFRIEIYDFDSHITDAFEDRAEQVKYYYKRVFKEGKMVKRPSDAKNPDCKRCATCALRDACWNINGGGKRIEKPER